MGSTTPIKQLHQAGIPVGVGTDGAAVHNTLDVWESLRLLALTQRQREQSAKWMTVVTVVVDGNIVVRDRQLVTADLTDAVQLYAP